MEGGKTEDDKAGRDRKTFGMGLLNERDSVRSERMRFDKSRRDIIGCNR